MKYGIRKTIAWLIGLILTLMWFGIWKGNGGGLGWGQFTSFVFCLLVIFNASFVPENSVIIGFFKGSVIVPSYLLGHYYLLRLAQNLGNNFDLTIGFYLLSLLGIVFVIGIIIAAIDHVSIQVKAGKEGDWFTIGFIVFLILIGGGNAFADGAFDKAIPAIVDFFDPVTPLLKSGLWFFVVAIPLNFALPFFVFVKEYISETEWYRELFVEGRGPSQRFAGPYTFSRYPKTLEAKKKKSHVYLGNSRFYENFHNRRVYAHDDAHLLTVAMTGSGKSVTSIWPVLKTYPGPMIVMDPKGEHADMYAEKRKYSYGGRVYVLDPFGKTKRTSSCYNLLSEIDLESDQGRKRLSAITSSLIISSTGDNKFWEESGRTVLDGTIAHVLSKEPRENHNLPFVAERLIGRNPEGRADIEMIERLHDEMKLNDAAGGLPQLAAMAMDQAGERAYGIITVELIRALKWATDPPMRKQISSSDFRFADLQHRPALIFIALPFGDMVEQDRWLRALTNLSMRIIESFDEKPEPRLLFILDELKQYGQQLPQLEKDVVTMRSAGVKLWPFVQNYEQLKDCFGQGAADFEGSSTIEVYGVKDHETAKWVANKLGQHIYTQKAGKLGSREEKQHVNALLEPPAIFSKFQKNAPISLVFPTEGFPMILERRAFKDLKIDGRKFKGM